MSPQHDAPDDLAVGGLNYLRQHLDELVQVPDGPFLTTQLDGVASPTVVDWHEYGLIRKVDTVDLPARPGHEQIVWDPTDGFLDQRARLLDGSRPMEMPCGHTGIYNDGEWIRCKRCGGRWTKEEIDV